MDTTDFAGVLWKECSWYLKCLYVIVAPFLLLFDMIFGTIGHLRVVQGYATMRNGLFGYSCDLAMYSGHKIKTGKSYHEMERTLLKLIFHMSKVTFTMSGLNKRGMREMALMPSTQNNYLHHHDIHKPSYHKISIPLFNHIDS